MGLYDDRLADLSEQRPSRRSARRTTSRSPLVSDSHRSPMRVQSLLFDRSTWTEAKAKAWAKSHGHQSGKVDVTDRYIRIRQFDPKGSKVKRTIPFGAGIRAVVAREESMATKVAAPRKKRRRTSKKSSAKKTSRRRHARRAPVAAKPAKRRRRKAAKTTARRRKRRVHAVRAVRAVRSVRSVRAPAVVAAPRRKRRRKSRRRASHVHAWRGDAAGHRKAARKGWRKKKAARKSPRRRKRSRRAREVSETTVASPRRRRRHSKRRRHVMETPRRRRRHSKRRMRMFASRGGGRGMQAAELGVALLMGGLGYVLADGLDRFLATYDPSASQALPTNKFTSTGVGTLANTLNVASKPSLIRIAAGVGATALPALAAVYVDRPFVRSSLEGMAVGAGVSLFKSLWNNLLMPMLTPKDTSPASLQKSIIVRLYPAEIAAHMNIAQQGSAIAAASGVLSAPPAPAVLGAPDVGPFALSGDSPYMNVDQMLRARAGVSDYPTVQNTWGTGGDSPYPTAAQVLRSQAGVSAPAPAGDPYQPGPPPGPGPGPQATPHESCGCIGDDNKFLGFIGDQEESEVLFGT